MTDESEPLFLLGPGFSATALGQLWPGDVYGSVRSETSRVALEQTGIIPVPIDDGGALHDATNRAHVVVSVPPSETGCPAHELIGEYAQSARSITYLSTTGVYGDLGGGWAMEWTRPNPQSDRAERRVRAETLWRQSFMDLKIARLPGIYGPGRSALDRLRSGNARRIVKPGQVFSRIHVEDIARGLYAMIKNEVTGVFHICDDLAAPPQDVIAYGADLLGIGAPPEIAFEDANLSAMGQSFYGECKRVSNARLKAATGWRPVFPSYKEGLAAILAEEA